FYVVHEGEHQGEQVDHERRLVGGIGKGGKSLINRHQWMKSLSLKGWVLLTGVRDQNGDVLLGLLIDVVRVGQAEQVTVEPVELPAPASTVGAGQATHLHNCGGAVSRRSQTDPDPPALDDQ